MCHKFRKTDKNPFDALFGTTLVNFCHIFFSMTNVCSQAFLLT